jgi:hypothetical protein
MGAFFRRVKNPRNKREKYRGNILLGVDQLWGTVLGIHHDETISSHLGKCKRGDFPFPWWGRPVHWWLEKVDPGHCKTAIEEDEGWPEGRIYRK